MASLDAVGRGLIRRRLRAFGADPVGETDLRDGLCKPDALGTNGERQRLRRRLRSNVPDRDYMPPLERFPLIALSSLGEPFNGARRYGYSLAKNAEVIYAPSV